MANVKPYPVFEKISLFLEPDCLFIFDVNTEYKHREILGDNVFVMDREQVYCVWANAYNEKKKTVDIMLDFFVKDGEVYTRYSEEFSEKAYTNEELGAALEKVGLQIVEIFDDMTEKAVNNESQRAIYVTKKVK